MQVICGIYSFTNKVNGKVYVGQSINIMKRYREHLNRHEQRIDKAIKKYGIENFIFEIEEICDKESLDEREIFWIKDKNSLTPEGYNMNLGGGGGLIGEDSPSAVLTNALVIEMRNHYKNKDYVSSLQLWRDKYQEIISPSRFRAVFSGEGWSHIMPEVFTEENYNYFVSKERSWVNNQSGEKNKMAIVGEKEVMEIREMYVYSERKEIFKRFPHYTERTITSILSGQNWRHLPIYKKREKRWVYPEGELNDE